MGESWEGLNGVYYLTDGLGWVGMGRTVLGWEGHGRLGSRIVDMGGVFPLLTSFTKWSGVIGDIGVLLGFSLLLIFKHDGLLQTKHSGNGSCRR